VAHRFVQLRSPAHGIRNEEPSTGTVAPERDREHTGPRRLIPNLLIRTWHPAFPRTVQRFRPKTSTRLIRDRVDHEVGMNEARAVLVDPHRSDPIGAAQLCHLDQVVEEL
jgi:hypothetical protein